MSLSGRLHYMKTVKTPAALNAYANSLKTKVEVAAPRWLGTLSQSIDVTGRFYTRIVRVNVGILKAKQRNIDKVDYATYVIKGHDTSPPVAIQLGPGPPTKVVFFKAPPNRFISRAFKAMPPFKTFWDGAR